MADVAVLVEGESDAEAVRALAERIGAALRVPMTLGGVDVRPAASAGSSDSARPA